MPGERAMRVKLKSVNWATKRLANGQVVTHYYAWRGGPPLEGEPGSPEFVASYERAYCERRKPDASLFKAIIAGFVQSKAFTEGLRPRTRSDYLKMIRLIEDKFGDLPILALEDPRVTLEFIQWRDAMASPRQADYAFTVLMRIISWGRQTGQTTYRPPDQIERRYYGDRSDLIWEDALHIDKFMAVAPEPLQWALILAAETGLRQGDILVLPWSSYDPTPTQESPLGWVRTIPSKSITRKCPKGRPVRIPATRRLHGLLTSIPRRGPLVLTNAYGRPWQANAFRKAWEHVAKKAAGNAIIKLEKYRG
jgi:integrase